MTIAIIGASGFLGANLAKHILSTTNWNVRAIARSKNKLERLAKPNKRLELAAGDVLDYESISPLLKGVDVAYYFVHLMGHKERDFYEAELEAATIFAKAAKVASIKRVVYMGGLGDNSDNESKHLHSRHRTGEILRENLPSVIELRASMIIGDGSVAYDIVRSIVHKLPVVLLPRSAETKTQPIALQDALKYLVSSATVTVKANTVVDIGGPDVLSYADVYREYAKFAHRKRLLIEVPNVSPYLAGKFLDLLTPKIHARIGATMAESMDTEMVVRNHNALKLFPDIKTVHIRTAFKRA